MGSWLRGMLRLLRTIVLVDLGMFLAVGLLCRVLGWRTLGQYGNGLAAAGVLALAVGLLSAVGEHPSGSFTRIVAESVGPHGFDGYRERVRHDLKMARSFLFLAIGVGVVPIAFGLLLQAAFP